MQQMTNVLLAKPAQNAAGSSKSLAQDANSEDFSAALASVNSTSSNASKSSTSSKMAEEPVKEATANDAQPDDEKDINLIFAQIDMATEMKKAAAQGENLPFEVAAGQNIDTENTLNPADTDPGADLGTDIYADTDTKSDSAKGDFSAELLKLSSATSATATVNPKAALATEGDKLDVMPIETTLNGVTGKQAGDALSHQVAMNAELAHDVTSSAEINAGLILKEAKLAVTLEARQETTLSNMAEDDAAFTTEFKPVSSLTSTAGQQQINRQELQQVQLSLRQGVETQNQMQEMIQRFSPVMKQQLVTMVSQGIQHAEIRLDPPELGHMLVKIQVHGDQTQVQFHVTQSQTRDVVEQAIPRLRELLQEQGMQLTDSHVSQGDQGQRREGSFGEGGSGGANVDDFSADELDSGLNQVTSLNSGIDYYA